MLELASGATYTVAAFPDTPVPLSQQCGWALGREDEERGIPEETWGYEEEGRGESDGSHATKIGGICQGDTWAV